MNPAAQKMDEPGLPLDPPNYALDVPNASREFDWPSTGGYQPNGYIANPAPSPYEPPQVVGWIPPGSAPQTRPAYIPATWPAPPSMSQVGQPRVQAFDGFRRQLDQPGDANPLQHAYRQRPIQAPGLQIYSIDPLVEPRGNDWDIHTGIPGFLQPKPTPDTVNIHALSPCNSTATLGWPTPSSASQIGQQYFPVASSSKPTPLPTLPQVGQRDDYGFGMGPVQPYFGQQGDSTLLHHPWQRPMQQQVPQIQVSQRNLRANKDDGYSRPWRRSNRKQERRHANDNASTSGADRLLSPVGLPGSLTPKPYLLPYSREEGQRIYNNQVTGREVQLHLPSIISRRVMMQ
ncbi:hypothetical protein BD410DRAFT_126452 [Rickenella mellea]|uniref:Uncharacterized protein n=1 Tax=Rickenella mellea TaxID=50990 RepID=A0A4Y7QAN3_9AGAM|nr:hypothetical protein BD410DRAFT_126452 [Rickenella mellea]